MARKHYRIVTEFTYANGMPGGRLDGIVNNRKAIATRLEDVEKWLNVKGHTATSVTITEIQKGENGYDGKRNA